MGAQRDDLPEIAAPIPPELVDAFLRLCQGDFSHRLPRTLQRDAADTVAFFFNAIAEEFQRAVRAGREQEARITRTVEVLSQVLIRAASGDLSLEAPRDFSGDPLDVLTFLVNSTIAEISALVTERQRRSLEEHERLERTLADRTDALGQSEARFRLLFDAAPIGLLLIRVADGEVVASNQRLAALFGADISEVAKAERDKIVDVIRNSGQADTVEMELRRTDGEAFWAAISGRLVSLDGGDLAVLAGVRDVTGQKELVDQLQEMASVDALTRLLNRRRFLEESTSEVKRATRYRTSLCCLMIDIDHFKDINDRYGHVLGDDALRATAKQLRSGLRETDKIGRMGGEEFAVLAPQSAANDGRLLAERLRSEVEAVDFSVGGERIALTVSIGIAEWRAGESVDDLLKRADDSLYVAKSSGRNQVVVDAG